MKIQKIPADNKNAVTFTVNETSDVGGECTPSISLPPGIFKGQGRVQFLYAMLCYEKVLMG